MMIGNVLAWASFGALSRVTGAAGVFASLSVLLPSRYWAFGELPPDRVAVARFYGAAVLLGYVIALVGAGMLIDGIEAIPRKTGKAVP